VALFLGAYLVLAAGVDVVGGGFGAVLSLVDAGYLPYGLGAAFAGVAGALLGLYALWPVAAPTRRAWTAASTMTLAIIAAMDSAVFFTVVSAGSVSPGIAVPLSLVLVVVFVWVVSDVGRDHDIRASRVSWIPVTGVALACAIVFPLAQSWFFGTTDYRRPADVAVVFGAKVHADGTLSSAAGDRVHTAVELYREGLVDTLLMSGGVGESGVDEARAMGDAAVSMGVPREAVLLDSSGVDTDSTVRNTAGMLKARGDVRGIAVSHFYHLPRIKLAYAAAGREVWTVPARERRPIVKTPLFVAREVPGYWVYWARNWMRGVGLAG